MQEDWKSLIQDSHGRNGSSIFSMFDTISEDRDGWMVRREPSRMVRPLVDFLDSRPICHGKTKITILDWGRKTKTMMDPTWKDIANFFHYNNDKHHIYFEDIVVKNNTIKILTGS